MTDHLPQPPYSKSAEQALLGAILRDNRVLDEITGLAVDAFYTDAHQKVYAIIRRLYDSRRPVDLLVLADELKAAKQIEDIGGYDYLRELWEATPSAANASYYAGIVRENATRRALIHVGQRIVESGYNPWGSAESMVAEAEKAVLGLSDFGAEAEPVILEQGVHEAWDAIDARITQRQGVGIPTGFPDLDDLTCGLAPGSLILLGARPSVGKTALAAAIAVNAARAGTPALFVSLEQTRPELVERLLCGEGRVNSHKVRRGAIAADEVDRLSRAGHALGPQKVWIDDQPGQRMLRIASVTRRMARRCGVGLLVVDYVQLIEPDNRRDPRPEQIGQSSRRLKALARELKTPVVALAQLNRDLEKRSNHRPSLADLQGSGSLEQDADLVLLLHRSDLYDETATPGEVEVIVAKHRNGRTGTVKLTFRAEFMRFENYCLA